MIDFGCGSGILAIAAMKLGARDGVRRRHRPAGGARRRATNAERNGVAATFVSAAEHLPGAARDRRREHPRAAAHRARAAARGARPRAAGASRFRAYSRSRRGEVREAYAAWYDFEPVAGGRRLGARVGHSQAPERDRIDHRPGTGSSMSLVTRCPRCKTLFRVMPAQLQARAGQVRCGRCMHVFDGFQALAVEQPDAVSEVRFAPEARARERCRLRRRTLQPRQRRWRGTASRRTPPRRDNAQPPADGRTPAPAKPAADPLAPQPKRLPERLRDIAGRARRPAQAERICASRRRPRRASRRACVLVVVLGSRPGGVSHFAASSRRAIP